MTERVIELILKRPGERIDKALAEALTTLTRSQYQRLIEQGHITVNGEPVRASYRLATKELVRVYIPELEPSEIAAEKIPLDIRYEDQDIIAINKPAGMVVHPSPGHYQGTLVNAILGHCPDLTGVGGIQRPGIVHRLDKDTSGLILVAKNENALKHLQRQFKRRRVKKIYLALVRGHFKETEATVDAPIGRDPRNRKLMTVIPPGSAHRSRPAQTIIRLISRFEAFTLLECCPITGRTHQIRVHLAFAGYPIVGDSQYGSRKSPVKLDRHFLHAAAITFRHPADDREMSLTADLPEDLRQILMDLSGGNGVQNLTI